MKLSIFLIDKINYLYNSNNDANVDKAIEETLSPLKKMVDFISSLGIYIVGVICVVSLVAFIWAQKSQNSEIRDKAKTALIASIIILGVLFALPTILEMLNV